MNVEAKLILPGKRIFAEELVFPGRAANLFSTLKAKDDLQSFLFTQHRWFQEVKLFYETSFG